MKVGELISILEKIEDKNKEVFIRDADEYYTHLYIQAIYEAGKAIAISGWYNKSLQDEDLDKSLLENQDNCIYDNRDEKFF